MNNQKIFFASDFHLGAPNQKSSLLREKNIVRWLNSIENEAKEIYLLGDIFDFWFEYSKVVPKGFVRLLGKLAELCDKGIQVHLFTGNHDMWTKNYLEEEIGLKLYHKPQIIEFEDIKIFLGHGDGLGKGDYKYKVLKTIFQSTICNWLFSRIHPNLAISIGQKWSDLSRGNQPIEKDIDFEKEQLFQYCKEQQKLKKVNFYLFGHRHIPMEIPLNDSFNAKYINLGDWITFNSYAVLYNSTIELKKFK